MNRLHVAQFTNVYLPHTNGVVRSVTSFRQALTQLGHNVFVFCQSTSRYEDAEPFIFRYPALDLPVQNYPLTIPVSPFMDRLLPSLKLDVLHAHHPALLGQVAVHKSHELALPLVYTYHTRYRDYSHYVALPQELVKDVIDRWLAEFMLHCHHVVVPSPSIAELLRDTYGLTARVTPIPTGVDVASFCDLDGESVRRRYPDKTLLISVARLAEEKNWATLLRALAAVEHPDTLLLVVGDGDDRKKLERLVHELGLGERVVFTGVLSMPDLKQHLAAADLFCFASITETQGLATLEAMAAGLPVVAVRASGTRDVVDDGRQGLLVANDPLAIAGAIDRLLSEGELRADMSRQARLRAADFDLAAQTVKLVEVYRQAIADRAAGAGIEMDQSLPIFKLKLSKYLRAAEETTSGLP